ncbi:hypothetical protein A2U01_0110989, partial [Trifolium medium]|nr:hypothetical protein [Trifolium medium]
MLSSLKPYVFVLQFVFVETQIDRVLQ